MVGGAHQVVIQFPGPYRAVTQIGVPIMPGNGKVLPFDKGVWAFVDIPLHYLFHFCLPVFCGRDECGLPDPVPMTNLCPMFGNQPDRSAVEPFFERPAVAAADNIDFVQRILCDGAKGLEDLRCWNGRAREFREGDKRTVVVQQQHAAAGMRIGIQQFHPCNGIEEFDLELQLLLFDGQSCGGNEVAGVPTVPTT